jgi:SAM-dependent methyltransferase
MSDDSRTRAPHAVDRVLARLIQGTLIVDRSAVLFDRLRSRLVCSLATDAVLGAYNALAYGSSPSYHPGHSDFRAGWFPWERRAVAAYVPAVPARVLVAGSGGGREALQLAADGYEVVAFDPVPPLVEALGRIDTAPGHMTACIGSYETLPVVRSTEGQTMSLQGLRPFDAGICGWASVAHVRTDAGRVAAMRAMAALVDGPILVSVYAPTWRPSARPGIRGVLSRWLYGDGAMFLPGIGRVQTFDEAALRDLIVRAGLEILHLDTSEATDNWPHAVVSSRSGRSGRSGL